jgi:heme-degrading monooxygenase HmoA
MVARVSVYEVPDDRAGEAVERFGEAIGEIRKMDGLQEIYFLISPENGRAITMTLWADHMSAEASRVTASRLRSEAAREVDGGVVSVEEYDVAIHERSGIATPSG